MLDGEEAGGVGGIGVRFRFGEEEEDGWEKGGIFEVIFELELSLEGEGDDDEVEAEYDHRRKDRQ